MLSNLLTIVTIVALAILTIYDRCRECEIDYLQSQLVVWRGWAIFVLILNAFA